MSWPPSSEELRQTFDSCLDRDVGTLADRGVAGRGATVAGVFLYDTARNSIVPFEPGEEVSIYVCGITPYDSTHLGHANTYLTYDLLIRRLEELGHTVKLVRNITDVDDSILGKARELGVDFLELAAAETARFHGDMAALNTRTRQQPNPMPANGFQR